MKVLSYDGGEHGSVEHSFNFVVEGLVIQIVNFDSLEVLLGIEVSLRDQESLSQHEFLPKIRITLILASS